MKSKLYLALIALLLLVSTGALRAEDLTGILGAFGEEVRILKDSLQNRQDLSYSGLKFYKGVLHGRHVVVAETGVGKVNAAMTTAVLIDRFHPKEVIFTGIAGAINPTLRPGDLVIGDKLVQHDLGFLGPDGFKLEAEKNPVTDSRNPIFFQSDARLLIMADEAAKTADFESIGDRKPKAITGIIATGDLFVASEAKSKEIRESVNADAVEMEGAAVAQVCFQLTTPFIVIRSMSDSANSTAKADLKTFYKTAATNSAKLVNILAEELEKDSHIVE